ncbi:MAG: large conductance mechanosensitive channel protein MscL [Acidimicrobiales bacterium]|nr:large conductance mechanosensitive channel protein MscL [Acidimicrobiales bacterium]
MKKFIGEFKAFILRGNVLDLAVAVVVGAAFVAVVNSFANGVLMNFVAAIFGQPSFDSIVWHLGDGNILIGQFLTSVVNFLVVAFAIFLVVKGVSTLQERRKRGQLAEDEIPAPSDEAVLLSEIRDLLRQQQGS